jgi:hypothetical protein
VVALCMLADLETQCPSAMGEQVRPHLVAGGAFLMVCDGWEEGEIGLGVMLIR